MYLSLLRNKLNGILSTDQHEILPFLGKTLSGTIINKLYARMYVLRSRQNLQEVKIEKQGLASY